MKIYDRLAGKLGLNPLKSYRAKKLSGAFRRWNRPG
jgi:hypothetical protein